MRIGIVAWDEEDPDSPELASTGRDLGHDMAVFFLEDVSCRDAGGVLETTINGEPAAGFDLIISRAQIRYEHAQTDHERYALLSQVPGLTVLDPADVYLNAESKFLGLQRLGAAGLPVAPTRCCASAAEIGSALADWGEVVIKPTFGLGGTDVERVRHLDEDRALVDGLLAKYGRLVCQPYYPHPEGDMRVTIVGDEAPLIMNRVPHASSWKANAKQGATANMVTPPPELVEISRRAARVMGVTMAGLDFLPTPDGYRIIEFNNCPGWYPAPEDYRRHLTERVIEIFVSIHESKTRVNGHAHDLRRPVP
ncbi:RimK family alpha-L-glutamate ligase [Amycolatopsis sp. NPDC059021]|uniref:ATP-grasp domain-containing protein n=1 Tax=Amycolatopsis sp. NPDC059021 TaxID=3346704 RepID=UPI00366EE4BF